MKLKDEKTPPFDNIIDTLIYVKKIYGIDSLLGKGCYSIFADLTNNQLRDEKDLIKQLYERGSLDCLKSAINKPDDYYNAMIYAINKLPKYLRDYPEANDMLNKFAVALGFVTAEQRVEENHNIPEQRQFDGITKQAPNNNNMIIFTSVCAFCCYEHEGNAYLKKCPICGIKSEPVPGLITTTVCKFGGIDWRVLDMDDFCTELLLIYEKGHVKHRPYHNENISSWATSDIRKYLNNDFFNTFSTANKQRIKESSIFTDNKKNDYNETLTHDRIFLLSADEVQKYFTFSENYLTNSPYHYNLVSDFFYWTRSPVYDDYPIAVVTDNLATGKSFPHFHRFEASDILGVRPALWLEL